MGISKTGETFIRLKIMWTKISKDSYVNSSGFVVTLDVLLGWIITHENYKINFPDFVFTSSDLISELEKAPTRLYVRNSNVRALIPPTVFPDLFITARLENLKRLKAVVGDLAIIRNQNKALQRLFILTGQNSTFLGSWREITRFSVDWSEIENIPPEVLTNANIGSYTEFNTTFEGGLL